MEVTEKNIGEIIRFLRFQRGWTMADLAEKASVSPSTMSRIESGERNPSFKVMVKLFQALGRPIDIKVI